MGMLSDFLRTEAEVRRRNDDGIWELLEETAEQIEWLEGEITRLSPVTNGERQMDIQKFVDDMIENIARSASNHPHSATRAAIHAVGLAIQEAAVANGIPD